MRVLVLTSNHPRHRYLANRISACVPDTHLLLETQSFETGKEKTQAIDVGDAVYEHFQNILAAERGLFGEHTCFRGAASQLPLMLGELGLRAVTDHVAALDADVAIVFGSSWIRGPLLSALPENTYNIHMGLSPFYCGHSTNFWAFHNGEPEMVGATLLNLSSKLDHGDIVAHCVPTPEKGEDYYRFSMKVVSAAADIVVEVLRKIEDGKEVVVTPEWEVPDSRYFESKDFTQSVAADFLSTHVQKFQAFLAGPRKECPGLVELK